MKKAGLELTNESSLITAICNISTGESRRQRSQSSGQMIHILGSDDFSKMDEEYLLSSFHRGPIDRYMPVKSSWTHQSRIQDVRSIGSGQDNYLIRGIEAIHLREDLVQGSLPLVVPTSEVGLGP